MSATIWPGITNSAFPRSRVRSSATADAPGPGILRSIRCRSPLKVSDRQSVERNSLSKILFLSIPARESNARSRHAAAGDMASFIIARPPGTDGFGLPFEDGVHGHCEGRKRSGGRPWLHD